MKQGDTMETKDYIKAILLGALYGLLIGGFLSIIIITIGNIYLDNKKQERSTTLHCKEVPEQCKMDTIITKNWKEIKERRENIQNENKNYKWNPNFDMHPNDIPTLEELAQKSKEESNYTYTKSNCAYLFDYKFKFKKEHIFCQEAKRQMIPNKYGRINKRLTSHYNNLCEMLFMCTALYGGTPRGKLEFITELL